MVLVSWVTRMCVERGKRRGGNTSCVWDCVVMVYLRESMATALFLLVHFVKGHGEGVVLVCVCVCCVLCVFV